MSEERGKDWNPLFINIARGSRTLRFEEASDMSHPRSRLPSMSSTTTPSHQAFWVSSNRSVCGRSASMALKQFPSSNSLTIKRLDTPSIAITHGLLAAEVSCAFAQRSAFAAAAAYETLPYKSYEPLLRPDTAPELALDAGVKQHEIGG